MSARRSCVFAALLLAAASVPAAGNPRVSIIIDDLGYQLEAGRRAIALPGPVAFAVLPGAPRSAALAERAHGRGKEVLLHLPLQANWTGKNDKSTESAATVTEFIASEFTADKPTGRKPVPDEPIRIDLDMSREAVAAAFKVAISAVPHAIGVNGHMGSLLTRHPGHMRWLMEEIRARENLFFVDSYTTAASVAMQIAAEAGVEAARRDVFLDPDRSPETVERQFERMKRLAKKRGSIVAIAHPYPATLALLERELPKLHEQGIELVPVSEIVKLKSAAVRISLNRPGVGGSNEAMEMLTR